ncbi:mitochondrial basic amino acids transporter-like [Oppia nitens]|uniref:mitochondrial basic amino acids transporter-like n=1 Tax=Oppia nitens TaxID=1686743 RepID=UPI0023DB1BC5|nr:mitochondrial basic amino acids transporter-like [Oppia nitens]
MASLIDFIAGCVGGAAGVLVGHPLDTIKVVMQTSSTRLTMTSVLAEHSVISLYRGLCAPLAGLTAINAIVFGVYGSLIKKMDEPSLLWQATAGCAAGLSQSFISCPIELIKTRAQLRSMSVMDCLRETIRKEGCMRGLYRGFGATIVRDVPAFATYFACYELLLKLAANNGRGGRRETTTTPSTWMLLMAGGTAGAVSWLAIYPLDVIKSRIQADNHTYRSMGQCIRRSLADDGFNVFVRGVTPTLVRAFPTNATTFAVVTWTLWSYEYYYCDDERSAAAAATGKTSDNILE